MGAGRAGNTTSILATGAAISMTDEATTEISGQVFQITDSNKRIIDPSAAVSVEVDASVEPTSNYTIDYLHGVIEFDSSQTGSVVTVTGDYLPYYELDSAYTVTLTRTIADLDITSFSETHVKRITGLKDASGSFNTYEDHTKPLDGQGGSENSLQSVFNNKTPLVFSVSLGSGSINVRAWINITDVESSSTPDGVEEYTWSFVGDQQAAATSDQTSSVTGTDLAY